MHPSTSYTKMVFFTHHLGDIILYHLAHHHIFRRQQEAEVKNFKLLYDDLVESEIDVFYRIVHKNSPF